MDSRSQLTRSAATQFDRAELDDWVCQANIGHYRALFDRAADPNRRQLLANRLAEEETKLEGLRKIRRSRERLARMMGDDPGRRVLESLLDDAVAIMDAPMGNIQLADPAGTGLRLLTSRGFRAPFLDFFAFVTGDGNSACGLAMANAGRMLVEDVERSPVFRGKDSGQVMGEAGCLAVQSVPLLGSSGQLIGMISTHWRGITTPNPDQQAGLVTRIGRAIESLSAACG